MLNFSHTLSTLGNFMKIIFLMLFISCSLFSRGVISDVSIAPSELNHKRLPMMIKGKTEVGINGYVLSSQNEADIKLFIRAYDQGDITLRGFGECGSIFSSSQKGFGFYEFDLKNILPTETCFLSIISRANTLEAPAIGTFLLRTMDDPNVKALRTTVNRVAREGLNWIQLKSSNLIDEPRGILSAGITENRKIILHPKGSSGKIIINGCGMKDVFEFDKKGEWQTSIDTLYRHHGTIEKECAFNILVNNNDYLKESAIVYISPYRESGAFVSSPFVSENGSKLCFEFFDRNIIGIRINETYIRNGNRKLCVKKTSSYNVEGVTSKSRVFWGTYDGQNWLDMK